MQSADPLVAQESEDEPTAPVELGPNGVDYNASDFDGDNSLDEEEYDSRPGGEEEPYESDEDEGEEHTAPVREPVVPLPKKLVPPFEVISRILGMNRDYVWAWNEGRLVSKKWKEEIESIAKTVWMKRASLSWHGGMVRTRLVSTGKVLFNGTLAFVGFEGKREEKAIFEDAEIAPKLLRLAVRTAYSKRFASCLGPIVHDLRFPNMVRSNTKLRVTIPWYCFIGRLVAEEHRVNLVKEKKLRVVHEKLAPLKNSEGYVDDMFMVLNLFSEMTTESYATVRAQRRGHWDRNAEERLQMLRSWWRNPDDASEEGEDEDEDSISEHPSDEEDREDGEEDEEGEDEDEEDEE